jgi:hypothetical protein
MTKQPTAKKPRLHNFLLPPGQRSIIESLTTVDHSRAVRALARAFAFSSIAYSVVQTEEFREFLRYTGWPADRPITRQALKAAIMLEATELKKQLTDKLDGTVVSLAVDGWTNVRHQKVTNVVVIMGGVAYYWCSITNKSEKNTAEWVANQLQPTIDALLTTHHVRLVSLIVDNEAVNKATHRILVERWPFLVHVPCAAHTIQLIVRNCLSHETFASTVTQVLTIVRFFDIKENRLALLAIQTSIAS